VYGLRFKLVAAAHCRVVNYGKSKGDSPAFRSSLPVKVVKQKNRRVTKIRATEDRSTQVILVQSTFQWF